MKMTVSENAAFRFTLIELQELSSQQCQAAKLTLCSEDVKTAALPPCEVPLTGSGCVNNYKLANPSRIVPSTTTPLFLKEKSSFAKAMEENGDGKKINQIITSLRPQGRTSRLTQSSS